MKMASKLTNNLVHTPKFEVFSKLNFTTTLEFLFEARDSQRSSHFERS